MHLVSFVKRVGINWLNNICQWITYMVAYASYYTPERHFKTFIVTNWSFFVLSLYTHPHENLLLERSLLLFQVAVLRSREMHTYRCIQCSQFTYRQISCTCTLSRSLYSWCYFHLGLSKIGSGKYILVVQYLPLCFCWSAVHFFASMSSW